MIMTGFDAKVALDVQLRAAKVVVTDLTETDPDDGAHVVPGVIRRALAGPARARVPHRPPAGRRDHPRIRSRPAQGAADGTAGTSGAARAVRRRTGGGARGRTTARDPVRRAPARRRAALDLARATAA